VVTTSKKGHRQKLVKTGCKSRKPIIGKGKCSPIGQRVRGNRERSSRKKIGQLIGYILQGKKKKEDPGGPPEKTFTGCTLGFNKVKRGRSRKNGTPWGEEPWEKEGTGFGEMFLRGATGEGGQED